MPHRLLIRLLPDGGAEWMALARDGGRLQGPQSGWPPSDGEHVTLLLPAAEVLLLDAPRLGRGGRQLAQALPFAIEEQLAVPVETQQVAFDARGEGERVATAVVTRARLDAWLGQARAAGVQIDAAFSEAQLLPWSEQALSLLLDGERVLLRWSRSGVLECPLAALAETLALLAEAGVEPRPVRLWQTEGATPELPPAWPVTQAESVPALLPWLAQRLADSDAVDLLQGEYRAPRRAGRASGRWRLAAVLAVAGLLLALGHAGLERRALQQHTEARRAEMEAILRAAVPGIQRVVDPVAQLRTELERRGGAGGGALPLLARIAPVISGSGRYTLEALDYRAGTLELTVTAADVAALDALRESLATLTPISVELTAATPGARGVEGRLRIREAAA